MKTVIQQLINSFENDRMQSTYSKEQILNLLNFKLEQEKQQMKDAYNDDRPNLLCFEKGTAFKEYYKETFKS
jgi:hypothetical protein